MTTFAREVEASHVDGMHTQKLHLQRIAVILPLACQLYVTSMNDDVSQARVL